MAIPHVMKWTSQYRYRKTRLVIWLQDQQHNVDDTHAHASRNRLRDLPVWLQKFTETSKTKKCQHFGKHPETHLKIFTRWHPGSTVFPTQITRVLGEKREKFDDLITAGHTVLNEDGESRNKRRTLLWYKI